VHDVERESDEGEYSIIAASVEGEDTRSKGQDVEWRAASRSRNKAENVRKETERSYIHIKSFPNPEESRPRFGRGGSEECMLRGTTVFRAFDVGRCDVGDPRVFG